MQIEKDPLGKSQHEPGAKVDSGKVRMHLITGGMARALTEVAKVGTFGAAKYTDGGWVHVPDGFRRYEDAQQRHAASRHMGEEYDKDSNLPHLAHEAWNALAKLDLYLREKEAKKVEAPALKLVLPKPAEDLASFLVLYYEQDADRRYRPKNFVVEAKTSEEAMQWMARVFDVHPVWIVLYPKEGSLQILNKAYADYFALRQKPHLQGFSKSFIK
jgi:hypothetical protein